MADDLLPVLMYHGLHADPAARGVFDPVYSVDPTDFAQQLGWLALYGYRTVRLRDVGHQPRGSRCVVLSFDDGDISWIDTALPLLRERRMVAEFFVTADYVGRPGMLSAEDLHTLAQAGMGIQSHGLSHRYLDELSLEELETELRTSKRRLEAMAGEPVSALALPGGRGGERELDAALKLGYVDLLNSEPGWNRGWTRGRYLQRLPITRGLTLDEFANLVAGRGVMPRAMQARYRALLWAKRVLGNRRYEEVRKRMLAQ
ncbi:MAG TPA: polysaccharide deacetylase family protein [Rudaea sp.]|nr:polysaccharide deacetylase family protein [Rudaea sp.]